MLLILEARDLATGVINRVRASLDSLTGRQKLLAAGFGAAALGGVAAAYELGKFADHSVKAAASFQQANTLLTTQAGVAKDRIKGLGDQFLIMAGKLAQTPQALTEAFYHIASASVPAREQVAALEAAAEGAAVGNANLEDTTNSLVGALRSGVTGFHGVRQAMATILAIVGTGNMRLQDFNAAMGTGLPGAAKTFGLSLQSIGAPLAFLTDTGMRAQMAATRLTMAVALLGGPTTTSAKLLHALGLTVDQVKSKFAVVSQMLEKAGLSQSQLSNDLRRPDGLVVALTQLKDRMTQAGLTVGEQAAFISRAFGGGHMGKAIMQIFEELPRVSQKFSQINGSVSSFGKHWQETTRTAIFQAKSLHGSMSAISTGIGEALLPAVQKLLAAIVPLIAKLAEWTTKHKTLAAVILGVAFGLAVLTAAVGALGLAVMAFDVAASPIIAIILGIMLAVAVLSVGIYELVKHWDAVWKAVTDTVKRAWADITGWLETQWNRVVAIGELIWTDFEGWLGTLWGDIRAGLFGAWNDVQAFFQNLWQGILNDARTGWQAIVDFFTGIGKSILTGIESGWNAVTSFFSNLGSSILGGVTGAGNWLFGLGSEAVTGLWNGMKSLWDTVSNWLASTGGRVVNSIQNASNWLYQTGRDALTGLWHGLEDVWGIVSGWLSSTGGRVINAVGSALHWLYDHGSEAITGFWNGVKDVWQNVSTWLSRVDSMTEQWFKGALKWLYNEGRQVVEGFWSGLRSVWGSVENWFQSKLDSLKSLAHKVLGIFSPSRVFADIGQNVMLGLKQGLARGLPVAQAQLQVSANRLIGTGASLALPAMGGGGGGGTIVVQLSNATFWGQPSPSDVDQIVQQIGGRLAQYLFPSAGISVRRG